MWIYSVSKLKCSSCYSKPPASAGGAFTFHHVDGDIYWDESVCYSFTMRQIKVNIEAASQELVDMCLDTVDLAVESEENLTKLAICQSAP
jgi:glutathionylspermidine synthase